MPNNCLCRGLTEGLLYHQVRQVVARSSACVVAGALRMKWILALKVIAVVGDLHVHVHHMTCKFECRCRLECTVGETHCQCFFVCYPSFEECMAVHANCQQLRAAHCVDTAAVPARLCSSPCQPGCYFAHRWWFYKYAVGYVQSAVLASLLACNLV